MCLCIYTYILISLVWRLTILCTHDNIFPFSIANYSITHLCCGRWCWLRQPASAPDTAAGSWSGRRPRPNSSWSRTSVWLTKSWLASASRPCWTSRTCSWLLVLRGLVWDLPKSSFLKRGGVLVSRDSKKTQFSLREENEKKMGHDLIVINHYLTL